MWYIYGKRLHGAFQIVFASVLILCCSSSNTCASISMKKVTSHLNHDRGFWCQKQGISQKGMLQNAEDTLKKRIKKP